MEALYDEPTRLGWGTKQPSQRIAHGGLVASAHVGGIGIRSGGGRRSVGFERERAVGVVRVGGGGRGAAAGGRAACWRASSRPVWHACSFCFRPRGQSRGTTTGGSSTPPIWTTCIVSSARKANCASPATTKGMSRGSCAMFWTMAVFSGWRRGPMIGASARGIGRLHATRTRRAPKVTHRSSCVFKRSRWSPAHKHLEITRGACMLSLLLKF